LGEEESDFGGLGGMFKERAQLKGKFGGWGPYLVSRISLDRKVVDSATKKPRGAVFDGKDARVFGWGGEGGEEIFHRGGVGSEENGQATAGFRGGLEGVEGFAYRDAADMDRNGLSQIEIGDDFKPRLLGERAQDSGEGFIFKIKGDGSPPARYPESEPEQGEKADEREKHFGTIH